MTYRLFLCLVAVSGFLIAGLLTPVYAEPVTFSITGTVDSVDGSLASSISMGDSITGTFNYNTAESAALDWVEAHPGDDFSSRYVFDHLTYQVSVADTTSGYSFSGESTNVLVTNDWPVSAEDVMGYVPSGVYDLVEILGATTGENLSGEPIDGVEWMLVIASDKNNNWTKDGLSIPDILPEEHALLLIGFEYDVNGNEIGIVWVPVETVEYFGPVCVEFPAMDWNRDCRVNLIDFSALASEWLTCNLDPVSACYSL